MEKEQGKKVTLRNISIVAVSMAMLCGAASNNGERWWSYVSHLADDRMEGRDTGSEGYRKAAAYVAGEFERAGLKPAGTDGYMQPVRFKSRSIDEEHSSLTLGGRKLTLGEDAIISVRVDPAESISAPLVFAGYGLVIPEAKYDDFAGLDVRGKIVVYLNGAPKDVPGPLASHYQSAAERAVFLRRAGVIGTCGIPNPRVMDIPWPRIATGRFQPAMSIDDPAMEESGGQKISIAVNPAHADEFLQGSGHTLKEILELADAGKPLPHFAIPQTLAAKVSVHRAVVESPNVAAILPGTDPKLKDECVVFSAHLDHIGIGQPIHGDRIYNGAMDNASGVAAMLDIGQTLRETKAQLRRSVLFVAVTGEEKGLLGSKFFAAHPTVEPKKIVADINTDMFLPLFPLRLLTVYGLDESSLGNDVRAVAKSLGIEVQPDPEPLRNVFIRSDQYSFIRRGVPSLAMKVGFAKGSAEEKIEKQWLTDRYHAPSDDLQQPIDKKAAGDFVVVVARLIERVANETERPKWNEKSFFRRFAD